jgi:hypothetical protein
MFQRILGSAGSSISGDCLEHIPQRVQAPVGGPEPGLPEQSGQYAPGLGQVIREPGGRASGRLHQAPTAFVMSGSTT